MVFGPQSDLFKKNTYNAYSRDLGLAGWAPAWNACERDLRTNAKLWPPQRATVACAPISRN